jgi:hypothetical protein
VVGEKNTSIALQSTHNGFLFSPHGIGCDKAAMVILLEGGRLENNLALFYEGVNIP